MFRHDRTRRKLVGSIRVSVALLLALAGLSAQDAFAQGWSFDARKIGLGGVGSTANIAAEMIDEQRPYRSIVLPFGLIQVYNYLLGFGFEDFNLRLRLDTDGSGLLTVNPLLPPPIVIDRHTASSGRGFAVDVGVGAVVDRWELGFGVNGIANRIEWSDVDRTSYSLNSLVSGNDEFLETQTVRVADVRVELPVDYRGNVGYDAGRWAAVAEVGHGFQGTSFHGGYERRFDRIELRGGARYTREKWNPTGGAGFDLSPRVSIDVAAYGTTANIERQRQLAIAASLRLNPRR